MTITPDQIPPEAVEAAAKGICLAQGYIWERHPERHPEWKAAFMREGRAAICAALAAWPGMSVDHHGDMFPEAHPAEIILPLQEPSE